jgi:hypothetical protein
VLIICGTPQKLHALFTYPGGPTGSEVCSLVFDEVDQLIARNLHEYIFNIVKLLPLSRSRPAGSGTPTPGSTSSSQSLLASFDTNNPLAGMANSAWRYSTILSSPSNGVGSKSTPTSVKLPSVRIPQMLANREMATELSAQGEGLQVWNLPRLENGSWMRWLISLTMSTSAKPSFMSAG